MIDLLEWIHPYVPGHSDDDDANKKPIKVLSGGDYLTFEGTKKRSQRCKMPEHPLQGWKDYSPK